MREKRSSMAFLMEIAALICGILFWLATTEYQTYSGGVGRLHFILLLAAMGLYIAAQEFYISGGRKEILKQLFVINVGVALAFGIAAIRWKTVLLTFGKGYFICFLLIATVGLGMAIRVLCCRDNRILDFFKIKRRKNFQIFILLGIVAGFVIFNSYAEPRWDGAYLYRYIEQLELNELFNVNALSFCNHISMVYLAINKLFGLVFGNLFYGMSIAQCGLYLGSIYSVYGILKRCFPALKNMEVVWLTALYAVSPFLLGLANYNYWDFWVIVLFPIIIYCAISEKWVYFFLLSFVFCFVKETAVISYAFYCLGLLIVEFVDMPEKEIAVRFKKLLKQKKYYGMLTIGLCWLYLYIKLPNWGGGGVLEFNPAYIKNKLAVFFGLNFNWILMLLSCGFMLCILVRKRYDLLKILFPLLLSDAALIGFNCLFVTINHARYINTHIVVLNLVVLIGLAALVKVRLRYCITTVLIGLMLIANYKTIDPVTLKLFEKYDVGNSVIISTTTGETLSDAIVYNQEYQYLDRVLDMALAESVMNEEAVICFPAWNNSSWFFDGIYGEFDNMENGQLIKEEFWERDRQKRVAYATDNCLPLQIFQLSQQSDLEEIVKDKTGYFFCLPFAGSDIYTNIEQNMQILEEKVFEYRGWEITRVEFESRPVE